MPPAYGPPTAKSRAARAKAKAAPETKRKRTPPMAPVPAGTAVTPAELSAALRRRIAAGPAALREAVLLNEILGPPGGLRARRTHRPGLPRA